MLRLIVSPRKVWTKAATGNAACFSRSPPEVVQGVVILETEVRTLFKAVQSVLVCGLSGVIRGFEEELTLICRAWNLIGMALLRDLRNVKRIKSLA